MSGRCAHEYSATVTSAREFCEEQRKNPSADTIKRRQKFEANKKKANKKKANNKKAAGKIPSKSGGPPNKKRK